MSATESSKEKNKIVGGTLYLVALPIGNLADTSERAIKTLTEVDFIAAEDTRNTAKLLMHFGIKNTLVSYHEHNKRECGERILASLKEGSSWALVTDAGTPGISDPGEDMVALCADNSIPVTLVPGACALIDALVLSSLSARRFVFEGFLEGNKSAKKKTLENMKNETRTMIFYEAPHRIKETLALMMDAFGNRRIALCRELTKLNEEIKRCSLSDAIDYFENNDPRGEYVVVVEGADKNAESFFENMTISEHVEHYVSLGLSKMEAIKATAKDRNVGKSVIYKEVST